MYVLGLKQKVEPRPRGCWASSMFFLQTLVHGGQSSQSVSQDVGAPESMQGRVWELSRRRGVREEGNSSGTTWMKHPDQGHSIWALLHLLYPRNFSVGTGLSPFWGMLPELDTKLRFCGKEKCCVRTRAKNNSAGISKGSWSPSAQQLGLMMSNCGQE